MRFHLLNCSKVSLDISVPFTTRTHRNITHHVRASQCVNYTTPSAVPSTGDIEYQRATYSIMTQLRTGIGKTAK